jgi:hypothetical protein
MVVDQHVTEGVTVAAAVGLPSVQTATSAYIRPGPTVTLVARIAVDWDGRSNAREKQFVPGRLTQDLHVGQT